MSWNAPAELRRWENLCRWLFTYIKLLSPNPQRLRGKLGPVLTIYGYFRMWHLKLVRLLHGRSQFDLVVESRIPEYRLLLIENGKVEPN